MKEIFKILPFCIILFLGCGKENERNFECIPSVGIQAIIDKGITIDSIALDYATIFTSEDGFPVIEPTTIDQFINKSEALIYFNFISHSRDSIVKFYANKNEHHINDGFIVDYILQYYDKLKNISVEVKKNNDEFYRISNNPDIIKFIPTPEINSGFTFAKYEMTIEEFSNRYNASFPESFIMSFKDEEMKSNTYIFRIVFQFNNNKELILTTDQLSF